VLDPAPEGFTVTPTFAVWDGDSLAPHQNFKFEALQGDEILFTTASLHEHDGLVTMLYTTPNSRTVTYRVTGDETVLFDQTIDQIPTPKQPSLDSMQGTELSLDGDVLRIVTDGASSFSGQWILRDVQGPVLSGWFASSGSVELPLATIHSNSEVRAEMFLAGRVGAREISAMGTTGAPVSELPALEDLQVPACSGFVIDPSEIVAGNSIRFVFADKARIEGTPRDHQVDYELRRLVEPLGQSVLYQWISAGPMAQTSFRVPSAGNYTLHVTEANVQCQVEFTATAASTETAQLETSFTASNGKISAFANVPGNGHYEYPMELRYIANQTEGSKLVWSGKLHSHGNGVNFTASGLQAGTYEWIVDVSAQGPDPVVSTGLSGHRTIIELKREGVEEKEETPVIPFALVALALITVGRARR
jgi:hypothetical protein